MKTAKLTWLFIAVMTASLAFMPAGVAEEWDPPTVKLEIERSPYPLPDDETFPWFNIWKVWVMTDGVTGASGSEFTVAANTTMTEIATLEADYAAVEQISVKIFIHEYIWGWYINDDYWDLTNNGTNGGYTAEGAPYANATTWGPNATEANYNSWFAWNDGIYGIPIVDEEYGLLFTGTESDVSQFTTSSHVLYLGDGHHIFSLYAYGRDVVANAAGTQLIEAWYEKVESYPININLIGKPEEKEEEEEPLSLIFGLIALLSAAMIVQWTRKRQ
jgi:hypothetical protein